MRSTFLALLIAANCLAQPPKPARPAAAEATYHVSGIVVHALTGEPMSGVTVGLSQNLPPARLRAGDQDDAPRPPEIRPVLSAKDGTFTFSRLKAGAYTLSAGRRGFSQQTYQQHEQFSTGIVVGPDKDPGQIVFRLQPDASLSGRIVDEHNEPVPNAQVILFRDGMQNGRRGIFRMQQAQSSDEGMYRFGRVRPGKFYVAVVATPWYAQYGGMRGRMAVFRVDGGPSPAADDGSAALDMAFPVTFYPGVTDSARAEAIELKPGQRETADFALLAMPSIHVRVNTPGGEPRRFVNVNVSQEIFDASEIGARARSMPAGEGVTEVAGLTPGRYTFQVHTGAPDRRATPTVMREVDVAANMDLNVADAPPGVNVAGTLRYDGPPPSESARLVLRRGGSFQGPVKLQIGAKGEISSEQPVSPGTYELAFPVNGYQISRVAVNGAKLKGQSIQIGTSDVRLTIVVAKASGQVEGVASRDGKPMAGVMVVLVPEDSERPPLFRRDQSDSDGSFHLSGVTPGRYTLLALENGWDLEWSKPEVLKPYLAGGQPVQVALEGKYQLNVNVQ